MSKSTLLLFLLALLGTLARAQAPDTDSLWIEAGNLRICLRADGSLYSGAPGGAVQYRHVLPDGQEKWVKVVQDAGMWFGGVNPGGELQVSAQQFEPRATDFRAGIAGVPGSGKIWGVTRDQVEQHAADYSDNAIIDQPIEAIFAWPGRGNRFFKQYNGFALPDTFQLSAGFEDRNGNGLYEPDKGDYPHYPYSRMWRGPYFPEQLFCFAFYSGFPYPLFNQYPVQAFGHLYSFECPASYIYDNALFVSLNWENIGSEYMDSSIIGLYLNPDIGDHRNDYHGSFYNAYFAYNATSSDQSPFGKQAPVLMASAIAPPLNNRGESVDTRVMPVGPPNSPLVIPQVAYPVQPNEFYNYLNCTWRDGVPLTVGGTGYSNVWWAQMPTTMAFYGNPYTPDIWTEVNAENPYGDRRALLSWNYQKMNPGSINNIMYMLAVHPHDASKWPMDKFEDIFVSQNEVVSSFDGLIDPQPPTDPDCAFRPEFRFPRLLLRTYPNPVSDILHIQVEGGWPTHIRLYDAYKRVVEEIQFPADNWWNNPLLLPVRHLPSGVYYLEANSRNRNGTAVQKVIILH